MCVQTGANPWERPAVLEDAAIFSAHFPGIDFEGLFHAMSVDGCVPLTSDLALVGATLTTRPDDLGVRFFPFTGVDVLTSTCVKIPEMDHIVEWMENTALGTYMWQKASDWLESNYGFRIEFVMNCGCGVVGMPLYANGDWRHWMQRFNKSMQSTYGRTNVQRRDSIAYTTMTPAQRERWRRVRAVLEALPAVHAKKHDARVAVCA